jgi:hypothetical protein
VRVEDEDEVHCVYGQEEERQSPRDGQQVSFLSIRKVGDIRSVNTSGIRARGKVIRYNKEISFSFVFSTAECTHRQEG